MKNPDFVIVGSSGGGGTIAWLLANAGFEVVILELGSDWIADIEQSEKTYDPLPHDEFKYRLGRPDVKRRPRGDYNTFRETAKDKALPFKEGWTASMYGGGSVIWGTWSFRALPIDLRLKAHYEATDQLKDLERAGYSIPNWPVSYAEMEPYFNVAETLLSVSGDRAAINKAVKESSWYQEFSGKPHFHAAGNWDPQFPFPCAAFPMTPPGYVVEAGFRRLGWETAPLPSGLVTPRRDGKPTLPDNPGKYHTRKELQKALDGWNGDKPEFWDRPAEELWSKQARDSCNMCGFCGEYLCWGKNGPKSGARASTLRELADSKKYKNVTVIQNAKAFEILHDEKTRRATGVRYLDISNPDKATVQTQLAENVIVACGAVQSARLLFLSRLGNRFDQLGRYATFHLFGLGANVVFPKQFLGTMHGQIGHTGNRMTFENYLMRNPEDGKWIKAGTMVSTAKKNPLETAVRLQQDEAKQQIGIKLLTAMEAHSRNVELRLTGDDLPMRDNRVDLDPTHVDEYGIPVARITRRFGDAEKTMFRVARPVMESVFEEYAALGATVKSSDANVRQIGDHQHGTCRMGTDPTASVLNEHCQVHDAKNVFVVDTSFMPTGLGLNPMVNVVANALRVGTWIVSEMKSGKTFGG